jgi:hypothetical protein
VLHVNILTMTASFAVTINHILLVDEEIRLGVLAARAEHEFIDKDGEKFAQSGRIVCAVDDVSLVLLVKGSLGTELAAKEFGRVRRRSGERFGDVDHVGNDCLDTVSFALYFDLQLRHSVGRANVSYHFLIMQIDAPHLYR